MARKKPEKEATLAEVLNEVTLIDVGRMLKRGFAAMGCWALFFAVIAVVTSVTDSAGFGLDTFGVPTWAFWLVIGWAYVHASTSQRSFHELNLSWYFPKLGWFSSLLLTAYLVGFGYLLSLIWPMPYGIERGAAAFAVWIGYTAPFIAFYSVINAGYEKLMEKRQAALGEPQERGEAIAW